MDGSTTSAQVLCRFCSELHPSDFSHCPKTGRPLTTGSGLIGRTIAGRYRVLSLLGEGGMGAVYLAEHLLIGREVALKRLHPELAADAKAVARFQREARAAAATGHEHIVEILDLGFGEDGAPFLVMELLRGASLAKTIARDRRLAPERACRILGQTLAALDAVHAHGIVHRDLKPDNILLTRRKGDLDFVKVVDFGISKIRREDEQGLDLTRTGVMLGTPYYMSPEQARGMRDLDHRVDLFAAGVILFETLAGQLPFEGANYHALLQSILSGKHRPIAELRPELPPELAAIVERAIRTSPEERFPSAQAMAAALEPFGAEAARASEVSTLAPPAPSSPALWPTTPARMSLAAAPTQPDAPTTAFTPSPSPAGSPSTSLAGRTPGAAPKGLAPLPGPLAKTPRPFVEQSADWDARESAPRRREVREHTPGDLAPLRVSDAPVPYVPVPPRPEPRAPSVSASTPASPARPLTPRSEATEEPTRIKASLLLRALEELREMAPSASIDLLSQLTPETRQLATSMLLPMAWVPLSSYVELVAAADRRISNDDGSLLARLGRATADRELSTSHRLFMQSTTPRAALERIPQLFRGYHSAGRVVLEGTTAGGWRLGLEGLVPDAAAYATIWAAFWQRLIELAGGRDVRALVAAARDRGDERTTVALRWR